VEEREKRPNRALAEPIRDLAHLDRIRRFLKDRPRDLLFFELAIKTGMPAKWLLKLKAVDLMGLSPKARQEIRDERGRVVGSLAMSESVHRAWLQYRDQIGPAEGDYLFRSQRSLGHLKLASATNLVNDWYAALGLKGPRGLKSLKATYRLHFAGGQAAKHSPVGETESIKGLKPVQMVPAHEIVYQGLLEAIVSGSITPGERLIPERIAAQMNVSRMPVREAMQRLRAAGFISARARGKMVANKLSRENLEEIQHIRLMLESEAAAKAALMRPDSVMRKLYDVQNAYKRYITAYNHDESVKLNKEFHMTIYAQAEMPILSGIIETLLDRISPYLHIELKGVEPTDNDDHIKETTNNHREILRGLQERDPNKVTYWLTKDHKETTRRIIRFLDRSNP